MVYPSVDTMEFYSENHLACGSDCDYGGSAVVQLWDIDSPESYLSFSASDSVCTFSFYFYVRLLEVNRALTYFCHSILLPLKSTLLATLSLQVFFTLFCLCNCSHSKDCIVTVTYNMQVLVMVLLAYLIFVLVLQLTICRWDLVVRYCFFPLMLGLRAVV
jgi:hypothetical protein